MALLSPFAQLHLTALLWFGDIGSVRLHGLVQKLSTKRRYIYDYYTFNITKFNIYH